MKYRQVPRRHINCESRNRTGRVERMTPDNPPRLFPLCLARSRRQPVARAKRRSPLGCLAPNGLRSLASPRGSAYTSPALIVYPESIR